MSTLNIDIALQLDKFTANINKMNSQFNDFASKTDVSAKKLTNTIDGISKGLLGVVGVTGFSAIAKQILDTNKEFETLRATLTSIEGSATGGVSAFEKIQKIAIETPYEVKDLTEAYIKLKNFGIEPTTEVMMALTNQTSKLGGGSERLSGITLALGQAWAKGKFQAEEMNQLIERGVPVYKLLEKATHKNTAEIQELASAGKLGRDVMLKFFDIMGKDSMGANSAQMETLAGKISNLSDAWARWQDVMLGDQSEGAIKRIVESTSILLNMLSDSKISLETPMREARQFFEFMFAGVSKLS